MQESIEANHLDQVVARGPDPMGVSVKWQDYFHLIGYSAVSECLLGARDGAVNEIVPVLLEASFWCMGMSGDHRKN